MEAIDALVVFGIVNALIMIFAERCFGYNSSIYSQQMYCAPSGEKRELYVNKLLYAILFGNSKKISKDKFRVFFDKYG